MATYDTSAPYDSIALYDTGGSLTVAAIYEIQQALNVLASTTGLDAQKAANVYAGTTGLELVAALNCKFRGVTTWNAFVAGGFVASDLNGVCNQLNGTKTMEAQDALSQLAGGGHSNAV